MKELLKNILEASGVCAFGIVRPKIFKDFGEIAAKRGRVSLVKGELEERIDPFLIMPDAKSIIVCLFSYFTDNTLNCEYPKISSYAKGRDYHTVIKQKLSKAAKILENNGYLAECFADTGSLSDRHLAYLAGLGFFGKNGMLINKDYGSKVFIGYIITDCEMKEDKPYPQSLCKECGKCIKACPGGAIGENFEFREELCVSFLTQKKGELSEKEADIIKKSGYIWGCDICQDVCPYNQNIPKTSISEFSYDLITSLSIDNDMSNKAFKQKYSDRAFSWRGKNVILRNIDLFK